MESSKDNLFKLLSWNLIEPIIECEYYQLEEILKVIIDNSENFVTVGPAYSYICNNKLPQHIEGNHFINHPQLKNKELFLVINSILGEYSSDILSKEYIEIQNNIIKGNYSKNQDLGTILYLGKYNLETNIKLNPSSSFLKSIKNEFPHFFQAARSWYVEKIKKIPLMLLTLELVVNFQGILEERIFPRILSEDRFFKLVQSPPYLTAYFLGLNPYNDYSSMELLQIYINKLIMLGQEEYFKYMEAENKDHHTFNAITESVIVNEQNTLGFTIKEYNRYDILEYYEGKHCYFFTRNEIDWMIKEKKNPWTKKELSINFLQTLIAYKNTSAKMKLPPCDTLLQMWNSSYQISAVETTVPHVMGFLQYIINNSEPSVNDPD